MEEQNNTNVPKKRTNPMKKIVKENAETRMKKVEEKSETIITEPANSSLSSTPAEKPSKPSKATISKKESVSTTSKKAKTTGATNKTSEKKTATGKTASKKTTTKTKVNVTHITSTKIDPRTGLVKTAKPKPIKDEKPKVEKPKEEPVKKVVKKKVTKKTSVPTIEPAPRPTEPEGVVRPTPKKIKQWTKDEKVLYKKLDESFSTVANMAMVIEERTMDTKNMPNLTIGEIHLIEMVNRYNNKPMTLIANQLHITVGAMTICLNRLVQKGYVIRTRDEMDRRVILLSVTPEGKKILKFHNKFHDDILGIVLDTIPLAQATKVMSQFAYVLEYYFDPSIALQEEKKTSKKEKSKK